MQPKDHSHVTLYQVAFLEFSISASCMSTTNAEAQTRRTVFHQSGPFLMKMFIIFDISPSPKNLNNAGEDLKNVANHALEDFGQASKEEVAITVKDPMGGEKAFVESALRNLTIKEA